jgi:hypothetical protein
MILLLLFSVALAVVAAVWWLRAVKPRGRRWTCYCCGAVFELGGKAWALRGDGIVTLCELCSRSIEMVSEGTEVKSVRCTMHDRVLDS